MATSATYNEEPFKAKGIEEYFKAARNAGQGVLTETVQLNRSDLGAVHQIDLDISLWINHIREPAQEQLEAARKELAIGEYLAATGMYRQAFSCLRLFLELSFAAVHFSVNELERRRWISNRTDFSWSAALHSETGLLAAGFVREFSPTLVADAKEYSADAAECYRLCSEFAHGKVSFTASIPDAISYSDEVIKSWCKSAVKAGRAVLFLLYVRFGEGLTLKPSDEIQQTVIDYFGRHESVRTMLGLTENWHDE